MRAMHRNLSRGWCLGVAVALWLMLAATASAAGDVYVASLADAIGPATADFVVTAIDRAESEDAACLIIALDTPGGLSESMRKIVMAILASRVPVIVYVSPGGARAASAGVMITMAADVAAMAPGTNIGAAHPVGAGGGDIDGNMSEKVTNDMVAQARSVAEKKGRNADWVESAIRESVSITETEALDERVIDMVATDLDDLVRQLEGREVAGKGQLQIADADIVRMEEGIRTKILKTISDPNIAYVLMMIGMAGLYFELSHPGAVFPGVIGGICLILAFFAFQTLPVNAAGILLIVLAVIFFIMEMKITSYGLLSVAGVTSLLLGSIMLFKGGDHGMRVDWVVLIPTIVLVSGFFVFVAGLVVRSQVRPARTGESGLIGEIGVARSRIAPDGKVFVHGELWNARSGVEIAEGSKIRVIGVEQLVLDVAPLETS